MVDNIFIDELGISVVNSIKESTYNKNDMVHIHFPFSYEKLDFAVYTN